MAVEFVKGWHLSNVLGEGTYGEVRLLVNLETNECVATKMIDIQKFPNARNQIAKEICIHQKLKHDNIIKFYGHRRDETIEYIFLEYASGGELFDRIEPDVGMDSSSAHRFFVQLISGVEYLHQTGVVHRDLKPENVLLDDNDNIKISDFGMSTLFRHSGKERLMTQKCGTVPYMAPEIFIHKEYKAEPADIWSCGVILVTLMTGELPWDRPILECKAFKGWKDESLSERFAWNKCDNLVLSLLRKIMCPNVTKRYSLAQIKSHQWFKKKMMTSSQPLYSPMSKTKRHCTSDVFNGRLSSASQPIHVLANNNKTTTTTTTTPTKGVEETLKPFICFSQPAIVDNMLLTTQLTQSTQPFASRSQNMYQRLVRRMTRFFTTVNSQTTRQRLKRVFDKRNYNYKENSVQLTISTLDKRRMQLVFSASVIQMHSHQILVDFRLTKGDGIEFKRHFVSIRNDLNDMIVKGPTTWPLAFATHSLP